MDWTHIPTDLQTQIVGIQPSACRLYCKSMRDAASVHAALTLRTSVQALLKAGQDLTEQSNRMGVREGALLEAETSGFDIEVPENTVWRSLLDAFDEDADAFLEMGCAYVKRLHVLFQHYAWHEELRNLVFVHVLGLVSHVARYDPLVFAKDRDYPCRYGPFDGIGSSFDPRNKSSAPVLNSEVAFTAFNKTLPLLRQHPIMYNDFKERLRLAQMDTPTEFGLAQAVLIQELRDRYLWVKEVQETALASWYEEDLQYDSDA